MALTIVPSIDLRGGRVVRLKQGDYGRQVNYDVDPLDVARGFAAAGAEWMHVVDLDGAKEGRPVQTDLISTIIRATGLKVEVGGGIRATGDVQRLLDAGANRRRRRNQGDGGLALVTTLAKDPAFAHKLVLAVDAREGMIATRGWTETSTRKAADVAREVSDWPFGALLYTDVAKDGMLQGPNIQHTRELALAGKVPVIASGGVGHVDHIRELTRIPVSGAIVGRSLYEGKVDLASAIRIAKEAGK